MGPFNHALPGLSETQGSRAAMWKTLLGVELTAGGRVSPYRHHKRRMCAFIIYIFFFSVCSAGEEPAPLSDWNKNRDFIFIYK